MHLEHWRQRIDDLDEALVQLLNLRARFALEAARLKRTRGVPARVAERERQILERVQQLNRGPLDAEAVARLYEQILVESVRLQEAAAATENDRDGRLSR